MRITVHWTSLLGVALLACSSDPLGPGFEDDLVQRGGCGDVWFFAVDAADRVLLTFHSGGLVAAARTAGSATTSTWSLPDAAVDLTVETGLRISDAICDDVIENGGPLVDRTYRAVGGEAEVTIRPGSDEFSARGDLTLRDVVLRDDRGHTVRFDVLIWTDVGVGWLPG